MDDLGEVGRHYEEERRRSGVAGGIHLRSDVPARMLPTVMFSDATASLDADDFVEGVLTRGAMSVLYGESNCGKTFFALDLALHVAAGRRWRDREADQGFVLYLALEGTRGILNRVAAYKAEHGLDDAGLPFAIATISVNLLDPEADAGAVIATIKALAETMGVKPILIVVDTLARAMAGGNENAGEDMGALVINGDAIRRESGAHVMWIHHSGKDTAKGARGHSSLRAATDTEIEVVALTGARTATVTKQRDMECVGSFGFTLKVVDLGKNQRGKPVTSCVVALGEGGALNGHVDQAPDHGPLLANIADLIGPNGTMSAGRLLDLLGWSRRGTDYARLRELVPYHPESTDIDLAGRAVRLFLRREGTHTTAPNFVSRIDLDTSP